MVGTMSTLRGLLGTARMVRHAPRLSAAMPPDDDVLLDAPDERLAPALVAAALADPEPAAKLLATTREAAEWESRDRYVTRLATFACSRADWLTRWLAGTPHDPDALLVKTQVEVRRAWESPVRAERLRALDPLIEAAARAAPRDPVPWRIALDHARGTRTGHTEFELLWEQAVRRSPHHFGCHLAALKYLSARWCGSHRVCFEFAERAAEDVLPDSLIQALPARAALTELLSGPGPARGDRIDTAADRAIALSAVYPAAVPWPADVRNLLVYLLLRRRRTGEALEQFRRIGPYATSFPWTLVSEDPLDRFLEARDRARRDVARTIPLGAGRRGRPGRGGARDHYA
ncbi:hypothetical protein [Streptomyces sp. NBC_01216]|uniref:hypothetical protein n=1 Tax=unclassified Streptomyces TaxID=2593676 RepID=UPI002E0F19EA|nr:hypothetical protein OG393_24980 [Streptomyces sp. NBC_01216]